MDTSRRGFIGVAAGAVVAGPKAVADAVGSISGGGAATGLSGGVGRARALVDASNPGPTQMLEYLLANGIPERDLREIEEDARRVDRLDPDLDTMRSMSLVARVAEQRRRNVERGKAEFFRRYRRYCLPGLYELVRA